MFAGNHSSSNKHTNGCNKKVYPINGGCIHYTKEDSREASLCSGTQTLLDRRLFRAFISAGDAFGL